MTFPPAGLLSLALALAASRPTASAQSPPSDSVLVRTILRQDSLLFSAFNTCDTIALAGFFTSDIEFYHDEGGLTVGRQQTLAAINDRCRQIAHGQTAPLTRERLPESDAVYPVPGFGAMQLGRHRFFRLAFRCQSATSATFGFAQVWAYRDSTWQLRRVLSYDHH